MDEIKAVAQLLLKSRNILFVTGAGVSADSGIPTYRGIGGLYEQKCTEEGLSIEDAISSETLTHHPEITWKYIAQIEKSQRSATFNTAHQIISDMEKQFDRVVVFTQNIDNYHQKSGSSIVINIHGDLHEIYCPKCFYETYVKDYSELVLPPICQCGHVLRPNVVLFGEMLPLDKVEQFEDEEAKGFDIVFSVGTSSVFPYITAPVREAKRHKIPTVEINPSETSISNIVDIRISLGAAKALSLIWQEYLSLKIIK